MATQRQRPPQPEKLGPDRPPEPPARPAVGRTRTLHRRLVTLARTPVARLGLAGVGLIVAWLSLRTALPGAQAWRAVAGADRTWLALAVAAQFGSMAMFALQQRRLLRALGVHLPTAAAMELTYARTAICIVMPAGAAL